MVKIMILTETEATRDEMSISKILIATLAVSILLIHKYFLTVNINWTIIYSIQFIRSVNE